MFKKRAKHIKAIIFCFGLFTLAVIFLISSPVALNLAESKIIFASNQVITSTQTEVAGVSQKPQVEIEDLHIPVPNFSAKAVLAEDIDLNYPLYSKNIHKRMSPASTTKIMTALISIEYFKPADILTVWAPAMVGGSNMGLTIGETMTYRSLLYGMLLNSGNDAAYTIALNYPGGMDVFVARMNSKALEMGLLDTHFQNPAGFDDPTHYSSAYDLSLIAKEAIKNPTLARIVSTKETSVMSFDKSKLHALKNLNKLLSEPGVMGIKTGFTEKSGENLVTLVSRDGHRVLSVVLNSSDRFFESKSLIEWIFQNFSWKQQ